MLKSASSTDFEVEFEVPLDNLAATNTTHRVYATKDVDGTDLTVPVKLTDDDNVTIIATILLDHVKTAPSPWGVSLDLAFNGTDPQKTFTKVSGGWEITVTFDTVTGAIGGSQNQSTLVLKLNENAVPYDLTITGVGSMDAAYRSQNQNGVTITAVAYRVTRPT